MKTRKWIAVALTLIVLLTGCSSGNSEKEDSGAFKLLSSFDKSTFNLLYGGSLFEQTHPTYEVAYVNSSERIPPADWDAYLELLELEKPDVIAISSVSDYYRLVSAGLLLDLSPMIRKDRFDLDTYEPSVLEILKYPGETTELFGLSPFFDPSALYYNKTLFEKSGIPLPENGMTWTEMLQAAARIPSKGEDGRPIYGYHHRAFSTPAYYMDYFASVEGLSMIEGTRLAFDKPEWRSITERLLQVFSEGKVSFAAKDEDIRFDDPEANGEAPFLEGRVAMMSAGAALIAELSNGQAPFEWGIVSRPVSIDRSKSIPAFPSPIYAIRRDAVNAEAAWQFIAYMNQTATLKQLSKSVSQLPSRTDVGTERYGRSLAPFYDSLTVPPSLAEVNKPAQFPPFFMSQTLFPIINREMSAVLGGNQSLDAMMKTLQSEGQAALDAAMTQFEAN
jgi:multiple sugar transport system substrate-binding protein